MYVRFVIGFFSFFAPLGPLRLIIIVRHFPKECGNAAMQGSGKNTGPKPLESDFKKMRFQRADVDVAWGPARSP